MMQDSFNSISEAAFLTEIRAKAVKYGDFLLRSGRRSHYYFDKFTLFKSPVLFEYVVQRTLNEIGTPDRVAGVELGGALLAAVVSMYGDRPLVVVRKGTHDTGTLKRVEGDVSANDEIVLIEDVVTTGGSVISAAHALRDRGAVVQCVYTVLDREEGGAEAIERAGFQLRRMFTSTTLGVVTSPQKAVQVGLVTE